jgi:hypothetical protein
MVNLANESKKQKSLNFSKVQSLFWDHYTVSANRISSLVVIYFKWMYIEGTIKKILEL